MIRPFVAAFALLAIPTLALADPPKRDAGEKSADARDKVICKKVLETGSLVKGTRVCKTKWEWDRDRADNQQNMRAGNACQFGGTTPGC